MAKTGKTTKAIFLNGITGEISEDYDTVESWGIGESEFQYEAANPKANIIAVFFDDAEGAFDFVRRNKKYGFTEVLAIHRDALLD